jgi:mannose-6-phosphate isomerase-like protein (cupin superfamily)
MTCALNAGKLVASYMMENFAQITAPIGGTMSKLTIADALVRLEKHDQTYVRLLERNDFDVGMYKPEGVDKQAPHERDELYVIATGSGEFVSGGATTRFEQGDVLFAPARVVHRFANFSDDFAAWVTFIGQRE